RWPGSPRPGRPPLSGTVPGGVGISRDEPGRGGQHHPEDIGAGTGRCAPEGHDDGRLPQLLTEQDGVEFPLGHDQRSVAADPLGAWIDPRAVAVGFGLIWIAHLGLAERYLPRNVDGPLL